MVNDNVTQPPQNSQQSKIPAKPVVNGVDVTLAVSQYAKLIPNLALTKRFLDRLHYDRVTIQVLPAKTGKFPRFKGEILLNGNKGSSATNFFGGLSVEHQLPLVNDLIKLQQEQMGVFIMVNEGDGKVHPGKDTCRSSASVQELKACFVDTDAGDKDAVLDFAESVGIQPHLVVESSPGKFHIYFLLQTTYKVDRDVMRKWSAIQKKFMSLDPGYDQSMGDVGKLLRLPGFYHNKTDKPFLVEIYSEDHHGRYSLDELFERVCTLNKIASGITIPESLMFGDFAPQNVAGTNGSADYFTDTVFALAENRCEPLDSSGYIDQPYSLPTEKVTEGGRHQAITSFISHITNTVQERSSVGMAVVDFIEKFIDEPRRFISGDRANEVARIIEYYFNARNVEQVEKTAAILKDVPELPIEENVPVHASGESGDIDSLEPEEVDGLGLPKINYVDHPEEVGSRFVGKRLRKHGFIPHKLISSHGSYFLRDNNYWQEIPDDERNRLGQLIREFIDRSKYNYLETKSSKKMRAAAEAAGEPLPPKKLYAERNFRPKDIDAVRICAKESCVFDALPNRWFSKERWKQQPDVVAVNNGLLDIRTGIVSPHSHEFFNTGIIPCDYFKDAHSPLWDRALVDWFGDDADGKSAAFELQKWFGYLLLSSVQLKSIACFQGPRDCGKSTVVNIASILLGEQYTLNKDQKDLMGEFGFAGIDKAKLIFFEEFRLESITPTQVEALKSLTSLNAIKINQKHKPAYTASNSSRIMIATNSDPGLFRDPHGALAGRFLFWVFRPPSNLDRLFVHKIRQELNGVLRWAVDGARLLLEQDGYIGQPIGVHAKVKDVFKDSGKHVLERFVDECCVFDSTAEFISYRQIGEIFDRYLMTQPVSKEEATALNFEKQVVKRQFFNFLVGNCRSVIPSRKESERGFLKLKVISDLDNVTKIVE